jgi:hypothetical protein
LQDILDQTMAFEAEVQPNYEYWLDATVERTEAIDDALEEAAEATTPAAAVDGVPGAFWTEMNKPFVRWVRADDEDDVVKALARLHAARQSSFSVPGGDARYLGMFRAAGLTVPVWELPEGTTAQQLSEPMQKFAKSFEESLVVSGPLDSAARRARDGILSRQLTLR